MQCIYQFLAIASILSLEPALDERWGGHFVASPPEDVFVAVRIPADTTVPRTWHGHTFDCRCDIHRQSNRNLIRSILMLTMILLP